MYFLSYAHWPKYEYRDLRRGTFLHVYTNMHLNKAYMHSAHTCVQHDYTHTHLERYTLPLLYTHAHVYIQSDLLIIYTEIYVYTHTHLHEGMTNKYMQRNV